MARYQDLPNRTDTITVAIDDQSMCYNYGALTNCLAGGVIGKNHVYVTAPTGSCTWTVPDGVTNIFIEIWGAGGGGGGNGNCCCCSSGPGGGAGGYIAATIPTAAGCQYIMCAAPGGSMGCGQCTNGGNGGTSYVTGYNLSGFCVLGGCGGISGPCNACNPTCYGQNWSNRSCGVIGSSTYVNNVIRACGEGGHLFGKPTGCSYETKGGNAPFAGGIGGMVTYLGCCAYTPNYGGHGGDFPGGGASGAHASCCCGICNCGGCGAGGLVRIWY